MKGVKANGHLSPSLQIHFNKTALQFGSLPGQFFRFIVLGQLEEVIKILANRTNFSVIGDLLNDLEFIFSMGDYIRTVSIGLFAYF